MRLLSCQKLNVKGPIPAPMNTLLKPETVIELISAHYSFVRIQNCSLIRRGFNDHYLIESESAKYVFRIYLNHKYYIESPEAFQFELDLIEHLHSEGVPVANALRMNNGNLLGWVATDLGERGFALFPYAPGLELKEDTLTIEKCFQLGKAMADLHLSANRFRPKYKRYHLDLKYLIDEPLRLISEKIDGSLSAFTADEDKNELKGLIQALQPLENLVDAVRKISLDRDEFGIIHGDLHPGNVRFQDDELVMFDFDHCAYGWRAYDISISFFLPSEYRDAMLGGYESRRPLSEEERECLPVFFKLRHLWDAGDMLATESVRAEPIQ